MPRFHIDKLAPHQVKHLRVEIIDGRLPTLPNLAKRGVSVSSSLCNFCGLENETVQCGLEEVGSLVKCYITKFILFQEHF